MSLVTVTTDDGVRLDGAYYRAASVGKPQGERTAVFFIHAKTMNFYSGICRFAPPVLVEAGYDCLALNRRGHDVATILDNFELTGDGWTTPDVNRLDVRAGVEHLKGLGYRRIVLVGHSLGGWLASQCAAEEPAVKALVLASPADRWVSIGRRLRPFEKNEVLREGQSLIDIGLPRNPILLPRWPWLLSAEGALASISGEGLPTLADYLSRYHGPLLGFCGTGGIEVLLLRGARIAIEGASSAVKEFVTIDGCDHFYVGFEDRVGALIRDWLLANVPA